MLKRWNLIEARLRKGLKQDDVGRLISLKKAAVCAIEAGVNNPKPQYQDILEKFFSVPRETLFAITPAPKSRMKNTYEIRGDATAIFLQKKDGTVIETLIDTADLDYVTSITGTWYPSLEKDRNTYYAKLTIRNEKGIRSSVSMHRLLMGRPKNYVIDHINHDTLDNRRSENLREATYSGNAQNRKGATRLSTSGIRGVRWYEKNQKWVAHASLNGRKTTIGYFDDIRDAEHAVKEVRRKYMPYSQEALAD